MATLSVQTVTADGLDPAYVAADGGGDKVRPGGKTFIHVKNGGGGSVTITVNDPLSVSPPGAASFDPDLSVVVEPSGERMIGPLPENRFRGTDSFADITYSGVTSVTVAAIRL